MNAGDDALSLLAQQKRIPVEFLQKLQDAITRFAKDLHETPISPRRNIRSYTREPIDLALQ